MLWYLQVEEQAKESHQGSKQASAVHRAASYWRRQKKEANCVANSQAGRFVGQAGNQGFA